MVDTQQPGVAVRQQAALDELFGFVIKIGGVITGEHGIGLAKKRWWPLAASPELRKLHQTIFHLQKIFLVRRLLKKTSPTFKVGDVF